MSQLLRRDDIEAALTDLAEMLSDAGVEATFHIVGGAAIALTARPDRQATNDVDTWIRATDEARAEVDNAIVTVARRRGWLDDWLNDKARLFIPDDVGGAAAEWLPHRVVGKVSFVTARPDVLLAMKLRAGRGLRDFGDLPSLIAACGYTSRAQVEACFSTHYPHDVMKPKVQAWLRVNADEGSSTAP